MRSVLAAAAAAFCVTTQPLGAQRPPTSGSIDARVAPGRQLRAILRDGPQPLLYGKVKAVYGDSVVVHTWPDSLTLVSVDDMLSLEVLVRSRAAQNFSRVLFGVGAMGGASLYVAWCARNIEHCRRMDEDPDPYDDEKPTPFFVTVTLSTGILLGALGHALAPPSWHRIMLPVRVGVAPGSLGVLFYVSLPR